MGNPYRYARTRGDVGSGKSIAGTLAVRTSPPILLYTGNCITTNITVYNHGSQLQKAWYETNFEALLPLVYAGRER